jgi:hypothetical protein
MLLVGSRLPGLGKGQLLDPRPALAGSCATPYAMSGATREMDEPCRLAGKG